MKERTLTCIGCPMGCTLTVCMQGKEVISVTGNTCPRGDSYACREVTHPTRTVTGSIRVMGSKCGSVAVSCKTVPEIPMDMIFPVMKRIRSASVSAPVRIGDVLIKNVEGTGCDVIATKNVD